LVNKTKFSTIEVIFAFLDIKVLQFPSYNDFEKYEGQVKDGKPQGRGNMTLKDGRF
jgi:hypothetical protein